MNEIQRNYLKKYNSTALINPPTSVIKNSLKFFAQDISLMMSAEFNTAFIQVIHYVVLNVPELKQSAIRWYDRYLELEPISNLKNLPDMLNDFGDYVGNPKLLDKDVYSYILLSPLNNGKVMLLSPSVLSKMLVPHGDTQWDHFFLYQDNTLLGPQQYNLKDILTIDFSIFSVPYSYALNSVRFSDLLDTLELGEELNQKFLSALNQRAIYDINAKMVSNEYQTQLSEIFNKKLDYDGDGSPVLKPDHYNKVLIAYGLIRASEKGKAENLLSLSAVFSRYSSSEVFGVEYDSPLALRYYSAALMRKAYELKPEIFASDNVDQFLDWNNRLLGCGEAFSCTAILSDMIIAHAKEKFPHIISLLLPPVWN